MHHPIRSLYSLLSFGIVILLHYVAIVYVTQLLLQPHNLFSNTLVSSTDKVIPIFLNTEQNVIHNTIESTTVSSKEEVFEIKKQVQRITQILLEDALIDD